MFFSIHKDANTARVVKANNYDELVGKVVNSFRINPSITKLTFDDPRGEPVTLESHD